MKSLSPDEQSQIIGGLNNTGLAKFTRQDVGHAKMATKGFPEMTDRDVQEFKKFVKGFVDRFVAEKPISR